MTRLSMSRPSWSVPSGWARLGLWKVMAWSLSVGLWGARTSAKAATKRRTRTIIRPKTAVLLRRRRRRVCARGKSSRTALRGGSTNSVTTGIWRTAASPTARCSTPGNPPVSAMTLSGAVADARIEERVREVDDEVDDDEGEGREQDEALDLLVVAREDGVDAEGAEAGDGEQGLDHDGATDEEPDLQAHHGHRGNERVLERVLQHDAPLTQALGARRGDVLRADDFQQARADQPRQDGRPPDTQGDRRHQDMPQVAPRARYADDHGTGAGQINPAGAGQRPLEANREDEQQEDAQEELGDGHAGQGHRHRRVVTPGVRAHRRDDGGGHGDDDGHSNRQDDELEEHRASAEDGGAPVPLEELAEPDEVLHDERPVQAIGLAELDGVFLGVRVPEQGHDRVPRDRPHHDEHHQGDHEDGWNHLEKSPQHVDPHESLRAGGYYLSSQTLW